MWHTYFCVSAYSPLCIVFAVCVVVVITSTCDISRDPYHLTRLIKELSPKYIVMYDPSIEFVRQVEMYNASNPESSLKIYFIFYESSVEVQVCLSVGLCVCLYMFVFSYVFMCITCVQYVCTQVAVLFLLEVFNCSQKREGSFSAPHKAKGSK